MARVTIEDSLKNVPNLFELIRIATQRAHQLQRGADPLIDVYESEDGRVDAPTVFALREIAAGFTDFDNETIPQKNVWGEEEKAHVPDKYEEQAIIASDRNKEEE